MFDPLVAAIEGGPMPAGFLFILVSVTLLMGMLVLFETGRRMNRPGPGADGDGPASPGTAAIEGAVLALLGLLIAFTFSGAAMRFDVRREMIVKEANDIGTAYLRLDLLPPPVRKELQDLFRKYLDSRLAAYQALPDLEAARGELARSAELQGEIWSRSVAASQDKEAPAPAAMLVLPALNQMFDTRTARTMSGFMHPPGMIMLMLAVLMLTSAFFMGYSMGRAKRPSRMHVLAFAVILAATFYLILDLEYPLQGLLRVNNFEKVLEDLRAGMN